MINAVSKYLRNLPGYRTQEKLVIIESDDWGSLRAPGIDALNYMQNIDLPLGDADSIRFNKYDTLAGHEDLENLFETLQSVKGKDGKPAVITAVSLVANPDFDKIRENNYSEYFYEPFTQTLDKYNLHNSFKLWEAGMNAGLFTPEFHGREHLNVASWMRALKNNDKIATEGFKHNFWGFRKSTNNISYQAAFDLENINDISLQLGIIKEGLSIFKKLHGKAAYFFVPPNGLINSQIEKESINNGINYISTAKIHHEALGNGYSRKRFRYLGKKICKNKCFLTRNVIFEPTSPRKNDWVNSSMLDINEAFKFKKPATVSSHRVNYIGRLDKKNSSHGLIELKRLLKSIVKHWPDVRFINSSELGNIIMNKL